MRRNSERAERARAAADAAARREGRAHARLVLRERQRRSAWRRRASLAAAPGSAGLLVAEGDSWFDYPFFDLVGELEGVFGYDVESVAHRGDTVEEMAYDPAQLDGLARRLEKLAQRGRRPKAVLLSGGGNDIAGDTFLMLLNHKRSALASLSGPVMDGLISQRIRSAVAFLASAITELCRTHFGSPQIPILVHGYDYPVPDGRGYLGGFWLMPGPWLEPGFRRKSYLDLAERCALMRALIDRFNEMLADLAGGPGLEHLHHVDVRGALSGVLAGKAYKAWWSDELHPTEKGFVEVARRFDAVLRTL